MLKRNRLLWMFASCTVAGSCLSGTALAAVDKVITVPWQGDVNKQHTAISGQNAQLKGVIKTTDTSAVYYKWVFGDGSESGITTLSGSTKYNVATAHAFTAASGTPFTAKLQVSNTNPFALVKEDPYLLKIEDDTQDARINIAIDKGLWWLYTQAGNHSHSGYPHTYDGSPQLTWEQTSHVYTLATPTASAIHAFGINGHKIKGNPDEDPYVEAVKYGMNYLVKGYNYYVSYPALSAVNIGGHPGDADGNSYGVQVYDWGQNHVPYQSGQIMDAIIASGVAPTDLTGRDFTRTDNNTDAHNWTYGELLQDMADMHAWGQADVSGCNGGVCGSWWYGWNSGYPGDNSASQWAAIGMIPAQQPPWNVVVPQWEKEYNANWLAYSMGCSGPSSAVTACSYNYFSYNGVSGCAGDNCQQTTTSGMVQMIFDGQTTADLKWGRAQKFIADQWKSFTHDGSTWGGYRTYGWYSFAKAMRLSLPNPTTQLVKTSGATFDWYYGDQTTSTCSSEANCEKGLAPRILEIQAADGSWPTGNLTNAPLTTAWMIITLRPTLFAAAPIACFSASPNPSYPNQDIGFDPSCSGHSESGKNIDNLTKFEWDWDNDGTFDLSSSSPTVVQHAFACSVLPCTYPVTLKVTDDNNPALSATAIVNINITNPPHPPVANAGGPYVASFCSNDSLVLDGSKSFDQDEGQHEAGCTSCANDIITAWNWDLTAPLTGFDDVAGKFVTLNGGQISSFFVPGSQSIGLRVADNTALAYPGSGQTNLTNAAFGTVEVKAGCICNLAARPKLNKAQLTWTHVGAPSYDIYRSTTGPNTGFSRIAQNVVTTYATYLDQGLTIGKNYWYRVVSNGGTCAGGSNSVYVKPTGR